MDEASLRRQLTAIRDRTDSARGLATVGSWWVGDTAGERRMLDDLDAGRFAGATRTRQQNPACRRSTTARRKPLRPI